MTLPRTFLLLALFSASASAQEQPDTTVLDAEFQAAWALSPALGEAVGNLVHTRDRAGNLKLVGEVLEDPKAPVFLAERLLSAPSQEIRWATSASLAASPHATPDLVDTLLALEADPRSRSLLLSASEYWPDEDALNTLRTALSDDDGEVRAEAVRLVGHHRAGARLSAELQAGLGDSVAEVRAVSARALGWLQVTDAYALIRPLLGDADAEVRLMAFQACKRLDASRTADLPELEALSADPDPHLRRLVQRLRSH